ncbi:hypothetical protein L3X38_031168 [Prunus dulcis]|uniref:DUF4283 domain-containing protein n=1 Tax=Prunus dulcis TaxID=3755 RepID=A0AAD4VDU5_PRUDU|nr:hypothetical protein L3X38_031168 [Prunus dulcis]
MEAMVTEFSLCFTLTDAEQEEVVIDLRTVAGIKPTCFLLVGKLLTDKPYNKEALRRTFYSIWQPKAKLFNGYFLALAKAAGINNPKHIPLLKQEFWVQVKGLPLRYMTRTMGKIIDDALGGYVVTDQRWSMPAPKEDASSSAMDDDGRSTESSTPNQSATNALQNLEVPGKSHNLALEEYSSLTLFGSHDDDDLLHTWWVEYKRSCCLQFKTFTLIDFTIGGYQWVQLMEDWLRNLLLA